nr:hypothetical protein [Tanacetum cinerariifolium]
MSSKEESKRVKRQGLKIDQWSSKRVKISKSISEDVSEEELKGMMQLVPLEEVYVEALQQLDREDLHQLWTLVKETFSIKHATSDKEKELWVELKRLFEPDFEDQLWTHHQAFMHDPLYWKLYDTCGVHHVSTKDQEIFMLVEKDYPLRKGLATVMISNKIQGRIVGNKMLQGIPTASCDDPTASALCHCYILHNLWCKPYNKVSPIATLNSFKVTITLQAKVVDSTLGNNKEYGHVARECQKSKRAKDAAYHKEKMLLCKQEEAGFQLNTEQADWKDDTDDEPEDQELEAHYVELKRILNS